MLLTTLTAAALAVYTTKTALGICRDQDIHDAVSRFKNGLSNAVSEAKDRYAQTQARQQVENLARHNDLLIARVFERATEDEKRAVTEIFTRYNKD